MDKKDEALRVERALKLALEALESLFSGKADQDRAKRCSDAITAIREALAEQPAQQRIDYRAECWPESPHYKPAPLAEPAQQQEPVAWIEGDDPILTWFKTETDAIPLYTSPPASKPWVGLTDNEKKEIERLSVYVEGAIRHTEAKLREKNA